VSLIFAMTNALPGDAIFWDDMAFELFALVAMGARCGLLWTIYTIPIDIRAHPIGSQARYSCHRNHP
jgi:hypothetical protein